MLLILLYATMFPYYCETRVSIWYIVTLLLFYQCYPVTVLQVLLYVIVFLCSCVTSVTIYWTGLPCDCAISVNVLIVLPCVSPLLCY